MTHRGKEYPGMLWSFLVLSLLGSVLSFAPAPARLGLPLRSSLRFEAASCVSGRRHIGRVCEMMVAASAASATGPVTDENFPKNPVIVGSGPTGIAVAIMLARRGWKNIQVYDRLAPPPPPDSDEWTTAGVSGLPELKGLWTQTRPSEEACLYEEVKEKYADAVEVHFNTQCTEIKFSDTDTKLTFRRSKSNPPGVNQEGVRGNTVIEMETRPRATVTLEGQREYATSDFLVGADGVRSSVRDTMDKDKALKKQGFRVNVYRDQNVRVYKTIPLAIKKDINLNYSARGASGINFDALPSRRPNDERVMNVKTAKEALQFFEKYLPQIVPYLAPDSCSIFAEKPVSRFPIFLSCGPKLNREVALDTFSKVRGKEALVLVDLSQGWDMPGWRGFLKFVLPIILDGTFGKLVPGVFRPNILSWIQNPGRSFSQVRRRKRFDNFVQGTIVVLLTSLVSLVVLTLSKIIITQLVTYLLGHIVRIHPLAPIKQILRNHGIAEIGSFFSN